MAACSNCGSQNAPEARFCTGCGTPLTKPAVAPVASPENGSRCPTCGIILPPGARFCAKCGGTVLMKTPPAAPPPAPSPNLFPPAGPPPTVAAPVAAPPPPPGPTRPAAPVPPPYRPPTPPTAASVPAARPPAAPKSGIGIVLLVLGLVVVLVAGGYFGLMKWQAARKTAREAATAQLAPPVSAPPATAPPAVTPPPEVTPSPEPITPIPTPEKKADERAPTPTPAPLPPAPISPSQTSPDGTAGTAVGPVAIAHPTVLKKVTPLYPLVARQSRIAGTVKIQVIIGADGRVRDAKAISGNEILAESAVTAVKQWLYAPVLMNGRAIEASTVVQFDFKLD